MSLKSPASKRYAQALVDAVGKSPAAIDRTQEELGRFSSMVQSSFDLKNALLNPVFSASEREKVVQAVMETLSLSVPVKRFILMLVAAQRVRELTDIVDAFRTLADDRRGRTHAAVESAAPLSKDTEDRLRRVLEKATGKSVALEIQVDPNLIGGLRARVGSLVYDGTIRGELDQLKARLTAAE